MTLLYSRLIQITSQSALFMLIFIHSQSRKTDWLLNFSRKEILQDEPFVYNEGILHHEEGVDIIPTNCQMIMTSHNTNLMTNRIWSVLEQSMPRW